MEGRHSILRPLTLVEQQFLVIEMCNFFSPINYREMCKVTGVEAAKGQILPLSLGGFFKYLNLIKNFEAYRYMGHIERIIQKLINNAILTPAGSRAEGSPPFNHCYYSKLEVTEMQRTNIFWLGKILGEEFLMEKYKPFIVRFEGSYKNGSSGTGSGIIIDEKTILTCRHNLTDLDEYDCYLGESKLCLLEHKYHDVHDIGIVKLANPINISPFPYFGIPYVLDDTLTMGYPPLRGMKDAALISQKGEINAICKNWEDCDCITISSTVRPGNSGCPVISKSGYIVGVVTQSTNSASSASVDKTDVRDDLSIPFYNAIASTAIIEILSELDNSISIRFENYQ